MSDEDDLFEFGDFEDDDSLELDLEELFGDLEALALDPATLGAPAPQSAAAEAPAEATPAPAEAPVAEAPAPQAAPDETPATEALAAEAPAPAPAPTAQTQLPQPAPVAPQPVAAQSVAAPALQPVYVQQPAPAPAGTNRLQLATIGFAAIVTLANFAFMALPQKGAASTDENAPAEQVASAETTAQGDLDPADLALLTRIQELEDQLREGQGLPDAIPTLPNQRHRAFDDIEGQIAAGEYLAARSRLYSLLAVVDRFDAVRAREIEEQASYLLADTYRLELEDQEHNL